MGGRDRGRVGTAAGQRDIFKDETSLRTMAALRPPLKIACERTARPDRGEFLQVLQQPLPGYLTVATCSVTTR